MQTHTEQLSAIDHARVMLTNAAKYLVEVRKVKPWRDPRSPNYDAPGVEAFTILCAAICHTYTRCLVCGDDGRADWTPLAHCEFCNAPLCDRCYEDHWRECEAQQ